MATVVCEPCRDCKYTDCVTVCPVDCFYEDESMLYIDPSGRWSAIVRSTEPRTRSPASPESPSALQTSHAPSRLALWILARRLKVLSPVR